MASSRVAWDLLRANAPCHFLTRSKGEEGASRAKVSVALPVTCSRLTIARCEERRNGLGCARPRGDEYKGFQTKAEASSVNGEAASASVAETSESVGSAKKNRKVDSKKKLAKDSDMPKRPPSAYFIFMETFRKTFKEENPDVKGVTASAKAGGEKWLQLSEEEKAPYIAEVATRKAMYEKAMAAYKNGKAVESRV